MTSLPKLSRRIPSLDGVRAIAVLLVINGHLQGALGHTWWSDVNFIVPPGDFGVQIFFVISGFLITTLLLRELDKSGRINFRAFFKRRALRIMPAFYAFIIVVVGASWIFGLFEITWKNAAAAALYVLNYTPFNDSWQLGHAWSLSIEEQFYLLWPLMIILVGRARALWVALAGVACVFIARVGILFVAPESPLAAIDATHNRADALLIGCTLAILWSDSAKFRAVAGRLIGGPLPLLALLWLPMTAVCRRLFELQWSFTVGYLFDAVAVAVLLAWVIVHADGRVGRLLNSKVMVYLGVLSYSLYLWQQPFLWSEIEGPLANPAVRLACIFLCANISHYLVEKPFLRIKERASRV